MNVSPYLPSGYVISANANQALEPTAIAVTTRAYARFAPSTAVAHL